MTCLVSRRMRLLLLAMTAALLSATLPNAYAGPNPLAVLEGTWRGHGTISPLGGEAERVTCRASYGVTARKVTQTIHCAGTDHRIQSIADLACANGRLTGSWQETTYGNRGGARGSVEGDQIYIRISGEKFNGRMKIDFSSARQTVQISQFDAGTGRYHSVAKLQLRR